MRRWASHGERGRGGDIQTPYRLRQADVHPCSTPQVKRANKNERLRSPTPQFEPVPLLLGLRLFVVARPALEDWTGRPLVRPMGLHNNPSRLSSPASGPIRRLQLHRSTTTTTPPPPTITIRFTPSPLHNSTLHCAGRAGCHNTRLPRIALLSSSGPETCRPETWRRVRSAACSSSLRLRDTYFYHRG